MPIVEFPYIEIPLPASDPFPAGAVVRRPLAAATITAVPGRNLRCIVCPDTGADYCLFPASFAALLGIDLLQLPRNLTTGVGSAANTTHYANLKIDLGSGISFTSYAGFTTGLDAVGYGLLGQSGFFEYYNVCFYHREKRYTIETT